MKVRLQHDIQTEEPILLAGWPGMGNVGVSAVDFLRKQSGAEVFGDIEMSDQFTPEAIVVEEGIAKLPEMPRNNFSWDPANQIIFYESEAQVSGPAAMSLTNLIVDMAERMKVKRIYTCAAFAIPVSYVEKTRVLGVATHEGLRDALAPHGAEILGQGMISGLNGLLLGVAGARGIEAACLLATIPQYAISLPNPRGSRALVETLGHLLEVPVDLAEFDGGIQQMDEVMAQIEERMKTAFAQSGEEEGAEPPPGASEEAVEQDEVPHYVMRRIEQLFGEVADDKERGPELKAELDRWGLYELYEDRFLDLFREHSDRED